MVEKKQEKWIDPKGLDDDAVVAILENEDFWFYGCV